MIVIGSVRDHVFLAPLLLPLSPLSSLPPRPRSPCPARASLTGSSWLCVCCAAHVRAGFVGLLADRRCLPPLAWVPRSLSHHSPITFSHSLARVRRR